MLLVLLGAPASFIWFRNHDLTSSVVIRYDPAVLGTPGLRVARIALVVACVAAWGELGPQQRAAPGHAPGRATPLCR